MDVFKNAVIGGKPNVSHKEFFQYKFNKKAKLIALSKLKLMLNLKMLTGVAYVAAVLKKIELSKQLMFLELE